MIRNKSLLLSQLRQMSCLSGGAAAVRQKLISMAPSSTGSLMILQQRQQQIQIQPMIVRQFSASSYAKAKSGGEEEVAAATATLEESDETAPTTSTMEESGSSSRREGKLAKAQALNSKAMKQTRLNMRISAKDEMESILNEMELTVEQKANVHPRTMHKLNRLLLTAQSCTPNQALRMIGYCGAYLRDLPPGEKSKLADRLFATFVKLKVPLDISHYNTLLRTYLENEHLVDPTQFLERLNAANLKPNRVTFQLLISSYCHRGNMAGATSILEHMKTENMPINYSIFHSLIYGHCLAGNYDDAKEIFSIMEGMNMQVDEKAHLAYVTGLIRSGKPWAGEVEEAYTSQEFSALQKLGVITALVRQGGDGKTKAREIADSIISGDTEYGFAVRNVVPTLIYSGGEDIALSLFSHFIGGKIGKGNNRHGGFFGRVLGTCPDLPTERVMAVLDALYSQNKYIFNSYLEGCIMGNHMDQAKEVIQLAVEKYGEADIFINEASRDMGFTEAVLLSPNLREVMQALEEINVRVLPSWNLTVFAPWIMFRVMDEHNGGDIVQVFNKFLVTVPNYVRPWQIVVGLIKYEVDRRNVGAGGNLNHIARLILANRFFTFDLVAQTLAKGYVNTQDMDSLLAILFGGMVNADLGLDVDLKRRDYGSILVHIHAASRGRAEADEALGKILNAMAKEKLLIVPEVGQMLKDRIEDEAVKGLVDAVSADFDERLRADWPKEARQKKLDELLGRHKVKDHQIAAANNNGPVRHVTDKFFEYCVAGKYGDMLASKFQFRSMKDVHDLVVCMCYKGDPKEAAEFLLTQTKSVLSKSAAQIAGSMAADPALKDDLLRFLGDIAPRLDDMKLFGADAVISRACMTYQADDDVIKVLDCLAEHKFIDPPRRDLYAKLLTAIRSADSPEAVSVFEEVATGDKGRAILLAPLIGKLLADDDIDRLQTVLNITSKTMTQTEALTIFGMCFLLNDKPDKARKIFKMDTIVLNGRQFDWAFQYLATFGQPEAVEAFCGYAAKMRKKFATARVYKASLPMMAAQPAAKLADVWLTMQENGIVPDDEVKFAIAKWLMAAKLDVPFAVPSLEQAQQATLAWRPAQRHPLAQPPAGPSGPAAGTRSSPAQGRIITLKAYNDNDNDSSDDSSSSSDDSDNEKHQQEKEAPKIEEEVKK